MYHVFVWITTHYSEMPDDFKKSFQESECIEARLFLSDCVQPDSEINQTFKNYE